MALTNFSNNRTIPRAGTSKSKPTTTNFSKGVATYKPNDTMGYDEIYLAQNARFDRIGEYITRHGLAKMCEPIGKETIVDNYDENYTLVPADNVEYQISGENAIYSINITAKTTSQEYGILQMDLLDADDNIIATSCSNEVTSTANDIEFVFESAPSAPAKIKLHTQRGGQQQFMVATVDNELMVKIQTATAGQITNLFEANINGAKTILFTFKTDTSTTLYRMSELGAITAIRTLPTGVEKVRFCQDINKIRYADGQEGPRIIDPNSNWSDTAIPTKDTKTGVDLNIKVSNILDGTEDNIIYFDADTTTQAVWTYPYGFTYAPEADYTTTDAIAPYDEDEPQPQTSTINFSSLTPATETVEVGNLIVDTDGNYGIVASVDTSSCVVNSDNHNAEPINSYDAFDRDFRQNFPAIETGDPLTAMFNLGGVIYFLTRRNKYYMYSQTADVWTQAVSSAQHGTFSQESVVCDLNYAYYANDDGVYIFDGSSEASLTQNTIQNVYDAIENKDKIVLEMFNNRLFIFYPSTANGENDRCLVYNINLKVWESFDTNTRVSATIARQTASNRFICGHNAFGVVLSYENQNNAYSDCGAPIAFDLETSYLNFGTPSQKHRITKWRPEFAVAENPYFVQCGYALDFTDDVKYAYSINLLNGQAFSESYEWDNPSNYGVQTIPTKLTTIPTVNGSFRRCQIRYQHHAAFEPINFKSHTLTVETQRIR